MDGYPEVFLSLPLLTWCPAEAGPLSRCRHTHPQHTYTQPHPTPTPSGRAAERVLDGLVEQFQVWLPSPSDVGSPQSSHVSVVQPDDCFTSRCTQLSHCGPS